jgi:hypothetical protein
MTALLLVAAPLVAAGIVLLIGPRGPRALVATIAVAAPAFAFGAALAIAQGLSTGRDAISVDFGRWLPLRGADIALRVEPAAVPLLVALTATATVIAIFALRDVPHATSAGFFVSFELLVAGALGVVVAANLVVLLAAWGIVGTAVAQLTRGRDNGATSARDGAAALVIARLSDACLLLATIALLALVQTVDLAELIARVGGVALVPTAQRVVFTASTLIAVAAAARIGLLPFTLWLPDSGPRSTSLAVSFANGVGALLLFRVLPLLDANALTVLAWAGAVTAIVASAMCLARPRGSQLRAAAELGGAVAALVVTATAGIAVVVASLVARIVAASLPRRWQANADPSALVLVIAATLTTASPGIAAALAVAAVVAGVAAMFGNEGGRAAALVARVGDPAAAVTRSFAASADIAERGGDGLIDALAIAGGRAVSWTTAPARALGEANEWVSEALLVAGAIAVVAFWATR